MMYSLRVLSPVAFVFLSHLIGDFFLQNDWMALNKSKWMDNQVGLAALTCHALVYSLCFFWLGWQFVALTFLLHFITDAITSKATSKLWFMEPFGDDLPEDPNQWYWVMKNPNPRHWFFVVIGIDQFIHMVTLLWSALILR